MTDERHVARPRGAGRPGEGDPQPGVEVVEAHAVAAAYRDIRLRRDGGETPHETRLIRFFEIGSAKDYGGPRPGVGRIAQRALESLVGESQHHQVGNLGQVAQGRIAVHSVDPGVARIHRVEPSFERAAPVQVQHGVPGRALPGGGANEGDGTGVEEGIETGRGPRLAPGQVAGIGTAPVRCGGFHGSRSKRASRQASAALSPSRLEISRKCWRSGVSRQAISTSMSTPVRIASRSPMIS